MQCAVRTPRQAKPRKKKIDPDATVRVVVYDEYPNGICVKRADYSWPKYIAFPAIYRWLWARHGKTDLHFSVIDSTCDEPWTGGTFDRYY